MQNDECDVRNFWRLLFGMNPELNNCNKWIFEVLDIQTQRLSGNDVNLISKELTEDLIAIKRWLRLLTECCILVGLLCLVQLLTWLQVLDYHNFWDT